MEKLTVVKVGGAIVEDEQQLSQLLHNFKAIEGPKVLVHGGGRRATKVAAQLGIESEMIGGRRVTGADMLEVVTMVYGGLVNKNIIARLQAIGVNAIGLTGADMDVLRSHRRAPKKVTVDGEERMVDYGFVGDVDKADGNALSRLISAGITPVMAPLTHDGNGSMLNTNADTIAAETAKALSAVTSESGEKMYDVTLIYSFEKPGVMLDPDDDSTLIPEITHESFRQLVSDGTVQGGMIPKIENALSAIDAGVGRVIITLATAIDGKHGTIIK